METCSDIFFLVCRRLQIHYISLVYLIELDKSLLGNNLGTLVFTFFSDFFFFFGLQKNSDSLYFFPSLFFIPHSSLLSVFYFNSDLIRTLTLMTSYSSSCASETDIMACAACRIMKKGCKADCPFADLDRKSVV